MSRYYLGADVGATKTHVLIAGENGQALGLGQSGPGNHELVGYDGLTAALQEALAEACSLAGVQPGQINGAGFGIGGYDWPSERPPTLKAVGQLGLSCPLEVVNDTLLGVLAGSSQGWGLAIVAGTGCNCWGRAPDLRRLGQVTGAGMLMGEAAGASELIERVIQALAHEWTRRGPATSLTPQMVQYAGAHDLPDLLQGLAHGAYCLDAAAAPLVFQAANSGDEVANELVRWAGHELGELAKAVIRQLQFESLQFEVVLIGSLFNSGELLIEPLRRTIQQTAPGAKLVRLAAPPVTGAVILGMEQDNRPPNAAVCARLAHTTDEIRM
jgi:N-acetylglucosamine kinase-like BadF-type ATPase